MNKLFGLFLLTLACWAPDTASAACSGGSCFWIGGTGTVDGTSDNGHWATSSGGASCTCVPATTDNVTFDGNSGAGTVTINMGGGTWTVSTFAMGAFTGTVDFSANNNSLTVTGNNGVSLTGSATKTLTLGTTTTITLSSNAAIWNCATCANLTLNASTSTITFTGTGGTGNRRFSGGGKTYSTVNFVSGTAAPLITGVNNTVSTYTFAAGQTVYFGTGSNQTITTITNVSGSSSAQTLFLNQDPQTGSTTLTLTNNWTCDWCGFSNLVRAGTGSITATNSFDFKGNSGGSFTITPPTVGTGGGRIIGG